MEVDAGTTKYRILYDGRVVMKLNSPITIDDIKQAARQEGLGVVVVFSTDGSELEEDDFPFKGDIVLYKAAKGN